MPFITETNEAIIQTLGGTIVELEKECLELQWLVSMRTKKMNAYRKILGVLDSKQYSERILAIDSWSEVSE